MICMALLFILCSLSHVSSHTCHNAETCMTAHLNNPMLRKVLDQRCSIDISDHNHTSSSRNVGFTHVPKCGGSAVHDFLKSSLGSRYFAGPPHEPFLSSLERSRDSLIYLTILRDPHTQVISQYQYMRDKLGPRRILPTLVRKEYLWSIAQRTNNIYQWINNTRVRSILAHQLPDYFIASHHSALATKKNFVAKTNRTQYKPMIDFNTHLFLNYLSTIPEEYHCGSHLKVAVVLLQRYAVVGTLENMREFWDIVFKRLHLDANLLDEAISKHNNKSEYRVSDETRAVVQRVLEPVLFCQRVVWRIAQMISAQDKQCIEA